jgi:hypothetical protein
MQSFQTTFHQKKARGKNSKPKHDPELPSKIASTQPHGPCHDKKQSKFEMVLLLNLVGYATIKNQNE